MVLLTDAIADPDPKDWPDVPSGWDVRSHSIRKTVELVGGMGIPLYVVLVGDPRGDVAGRDREQSPGFVLDMVQAANGRGRLPPRPDPRLLLPGRRAPAAGSSSTAWRPTRA